MGFNGMEEIIDGSIGDEDLVEETSTEESEGAEESKDLGPIPRRRMEKSESVNHVLNKAISDECELHSRNNYPTMYTYNGQETQMPPKAKKAVEKSKVGQPLPKGLFLVTKEN